MVEKSKSKEELGKISLQSADISLDMLQETNLALKQHIEYLSDKCDRKRDEISKLESEIESYKKYVDKIRKLLNKIWGMENIPQSVLDIVEEIKNLEIP